MKAIWEIKEEIALFLEKVVDHKDCLILDSNGKAEFFSDYVEAAEFILRAMTGFLTEPNIQECSTLAGMWKAIQKDYLTDEEECFGDICNIYVREYDSTKGMILVRVA